MQQANRESLSMVITETNIVFLHLILCFPHEVTFNLDNRIISK